ncbi:hypothetical protein ACRS6B_21620 [Nocardia asteroides]
MEHDADLAQARVFVELLTARAQTLAREIGFTYRGNPAARHELHSELRAVHRYIDRLHHRFPEIGLAEDDRPMAAAPGTWRTLG